jgi:hypothetical protein
LSLANLLTVADILLFFRFCFRLLLTQDGTNPTPISEEEALIRKKEDKLFAKMAEPPSTNNAVMLLLGKDDDDDDDAEAELTGCKAAKSPVKRRRKLSD